MLRLIDIDFTDFVTNRDVELEVCYFELINDMEMSDGVVFESGTILVKLMDTEEGGMFFAEASDYGPSYLWVYESDTKLKEKVVETWTPDKFRLQRKFIVNDFL